DGVTDAFFEIDDAAFAEIGAKLTGFDIDGKQTRVYAVHYDALGADIAVRQVGRLIIGKTTAGSAIGDGILGHLRIVAPDFEARCGIHRHDKVHRGADEKLVADLERRVLVGIA